MRLLRPGLLLLPLLFIPASRPARAQNLITYTVQPQMAEKTLRIRIAVPNVHDLTVRLQMPVWMPGAYFIGNFATNVSDVSANDRHNRPLKVYHTDANTWAVGANGAKAVELQYTLKGADLEMANGAPRRGHISGPRAYMYVVGRKAEPAILELVTPPGAAVWRIATSLDPAGPTTRSTAPATVSRFKAPTYDVLADAPVEMGDFKELQFESGGKPHRVVAYGETDKIDLPKLADYCKRIADTEIGFFGEAPFARYVFEFRSSNSPTRGAGGLEHLGSTEIGTVGTVNDVVRSVVAHEYFHLWNVKRIRPFVLGPFNYVEPPHTANLWWSEGVTSYYGDLLSLRGGLNTRPEYFKHVSTTVGELMNDEARLHVSADESSLRVWEANNSQGYGGLSYYTKGELIGLCMDLKLRSVTSGRYSLDDVMRSLYTQVRHGDGPGFDEDDIKRTAVRFGGADMADLYDRLARSTDELPLQECLAYAGLDLVRVEPPRVLPFGGYAARPDRDGRSLRVTVAPGGPMEAAGVKTGDHIVKVEDVSEPAAMLKALGAAKPGDHVKLSVTQGETTREIDLAFRSRTVYDWKLDPNPSAPPAAVALRDQWLNGK